MSLHLPALLSYTLQLDLQTKQPSHSLHQFRRNKALVESLPPATLHPDPVPASHAVAELERSEEDAAEMGHVGEESM